MLILLDWTESQAGTVDHFEILSDKEPPPAPPLDKMCFLCNWYLQQHEQYRVRGSLAVWSVRSVYGILGFTVELNVKHKIYVPR